MRRSFKFMKDLSESKFASYVINLLFAFPGFDLSSLVYFLSITLKCKINLNS